jgi:hypothetical protein
MSTGCWVIVSIGVVLLFVVAATGRKKTTSKSRRQSSERRMVAHPTRGRLRESVPKPTFTWFIGPKSMKVWFDSAESSLHRLRRVKGYSAEVLDSTGERASIDITAKDDAHVPEVVRSLGCQLLSYVQFKGVIRGKPRLIKDAKELELLAVLSDRLLSQEDAKHIIKPGEPGSEWSGYVHTGPSVRTAKVRRAVRYGENTYLCVVRFTPKATGAVGGGCRFDQCLGIAGGLLVLNVGVSGAMAE